MSSEQGASMIVCETTRLNLRQLQLSDASFVLELVNEPAWLRFIGDRGVKTLKDARRYLQDGPLASYEHFGFGLYAVELRADAIPIGMCGLLKRETLEDIDIGFALLERHWGRGYALESAAAVMELAKDRFALKRVVAITTTDNRSSAALLEKIGMHFDRMIRMPNDDEELRLFARDF
jgi:RimJ/RimL family protein N-acetyltransferase